MTGLQQPRSATQLLLDRHFGGLFWGKMISLVAIWMYSVVVAVAAYDATGSALAVAIVSVCQFAPQLALSPWAGAWADRGNAPAQIVVGRLVCAVGSGAAAAAWSLTGGDRGWAAMAPLAAVSLVVGIGLVVGGPAMQSVVPDLVTREEMPVAMALNLAPMTLGRIAGPTLAAVLIARLGIVEAFSAAAAGQLAFAAIMLGVRLPRREPEAAGTDFSVRAALRHLRTDRPVRLLILTVAVLGFTAEPTLSLAPPLADSLDGGVGLVGALTSSFGIGAASALVLYGRLLCRLDQADVVAAGIVTMGVGLAAAAAAPLTAVAVSGFLVAGFGFTVTVTSSNTLAQLRIPPAMRGRVMAVWIACYLGARPLSSGALGLVADAFGPRPAIATAALVQLSLLAAVRPQRLR